MINDHVISLQSSDRILYNPFIRNYYYINSQYPQIEIIQRVYYRGYTLVIKKTFWLKLIQRRWKNLYKQRNKIFGEGSKFMSLEVMWPASENVVNYDITELMFHGSLEYDDNGTVIGQVKDSARILAGMIKQVDASIQKNFKIFIGFC